MAETELTLPTFRYVLILDGKVVFHGFTTNLEHKLSQHQRRYPGSTIEVVGEPTTHSDAYRWAHAHPTGTDPRSS